jgi:hypothetical protein
MTAYPRTKVPSDVERADRILAGLTARQLAVLAVTAVPCWGIYSLVGSLLPLPVLGAIIVPVLGIGAALALVQRDGVGLDRLLLAAWRQSRRPARLAYAPEGVPPAPGWAPPATPPPAPMWLPARTIRPDGVVDLGGEGVAAIVSCTTISFALRTPEEQQALVSAFGRWLNSLASPTQIVITAEAIDLAPTLVRLRRDVTALPHPALQRAVLDHVGYLSRLDATRDLLRRRVLLVLREPHQAGRQARTGRYDVDAAAGRALCRAEDACRALAAAAVNAQVLTAPEVTAVLAAAVDPSCPPGIRAQAGPDELITARSSA